MPPKPRRPAQDQWELPDPADVVPLSDDSDWNKLLRRYEPNESIKGWDAEDAGTPLVRCLQVARAGGARCVVVETRYMDRDWRAEYVNFYARGFDAWPASAVRLHFFRKRLQRQDLGRLPVAGQMVDARVGYLGYAVIRPLPAARVGRTMLRTPPRLTAAVRTAVDEVVTFFGQPVAISAVPFMQQDAQLARCAHAAVWMCHYTAYRRGEVERRTAADISSRTDASLALGRPLPSRGLSPLQISNLFDQMHLGAAHHDVEELPAPDVLSYLDETSPPSPTREEPEGLARAVSALVCRYLNSSRPVLVVSHRHAFVLCGWRRPRGSRGGGRPVDLVYHDDQRGPYLLLSAARLGRQIANGDGDDDLCWESLLVPLPEKVWLAGEDAETIGAEVLLTAAQQWAVTRTDSRQLLRAFSDEEVAFRTYVLESNTYKRNLSSRPGLDAEAVHEYRVARWPRYVWVVEAIDRRFRPLGSARGAADARCVLGEAIIDPTGGTRQSVPLAVRIGRDLNIRLTTGDTRPARVGTPPYATGGVGPA